MIVGGYERNPAPWCSRRRASPPTSTTGSSTRTGTASRRSPRPASRSCRRSSTPTCIQLINGPEAFTPDGEFILGESEVAGFFVAAGFCAHGIAGAGGVGQGDRRVDRRRRAADGPVEDGRPPLRPQYRCRGYCLARTDEVYSTYYDIVYPNHERAGRAAAAHPTGLRPPRRARRGVRREERAGSGSTGTPATRTRRTSTAAPGVGRRALVDGDRHRGPRHAAYRWAVRRVVSFAKLELNGPGALALLAACARTASTAASARSPTPMLNRRGGIECDVTVTRLGPSAS